MLSKASFIVSCAGTSKRHRGRIHRANVDMSRSVGSLVKLILGPFVSFPQTLEKVFVQITSTNLCDLVMSIIIMIVVFIVKELNERYKAKLPVPIPIEVIVVSVAIVLPINKSGRI